MPLVERIVPPIMVTQHEVVPGAHEMLWPIVNEPLSPDGSGSSVQELPASAVEMTVSTPLPAELVASAVTKQVSVVGHEMP